MKKIVFGIIGICITGGLFSSCEKKCVCTYYNEDGNPTTQIIESYIKDKEEKSCATLSDFYPGIGGYKCY